MRLLLAHPEIVGRSCGDCQKWVYDDKPDRLSHRVCTAGDGSPMPRPAGAVTPCHICPKIPRGSVPRGEQPGPQHAVEMTPRNYRAYWHYLECKAVGQFPDDPIVRRNAALIRAVEDDLQRERTDLTPLVTLLLSRG